MQIFGEAFEKRAQECGCSAYRGCEHRGDGGNRRGELIRMTKERRARAASEARQRVRTKRVVTARGLERGEIGVKVGDGFDAAEIIFQGKVLVGGVRVFVWKAEADEHAGNFEGVMHLRDEGNGAAFTNENGFFAKAFFERALGDLEDRRMERGDPRFAGAEDIEFALYGFRQEFANVFFYEFGDGVRILAGYEARGKFCVSF